MFVQEQRDECSRRRLTVSALVAEQTGLQQPLHYQQPHHYLVSRAEVLRLQSRNESRDFISLRSQRERYMESIVHRGTSGLLRHGSLSLGRWLPASSSFLGSCSWRDCSVALRASVSTSGCSGVGDTHECVTLAAAPRETAAPCACLGAGRGNGSLDHGERWLWLTVPLPELGGRTPALELNPHVRLTKLMPDCVWKEE